MRGLFISFEGIEGSGKSTQIALVAEYLKEKKKNFVLTREPGGTSIGNEIRSILLKPEHKNMHPITELLLYEASRCQHIAEVIEPALFEGKIVLCDRYADATTAYQGAARKLKSETIENMHQAATDGLMPQLTFLFDFDAKMGLTRARIRNKQEANANEGRFEDEQLQFHEAVRSAYLQIAKNEPERVKIIDASGSPEKVFEQVKKILDTFFTSKKK
ncbi:MAG: dTMP kinase [Deltaproteobacteria bacterium CG_4_10_14_0_2_um_filter_43_8]|nr:MAG: dTMP kinase [Deltaproteobacteria bacterium CG11_big_fil_rev_8_21_14_0_20_42_23]PJA19161.1 MAG: dTMP kinase [Deltaproteobacteria bacterium CG_4_10_14_0_2_um_filter_43_8]PJC65124.1 MAG: dTMP kinase [Deltaproteobacteria bacterium CG_4_9_14_0_2_um_filter_42_21]